MTAPYVSIHLCCNRVEDGEPGAGLTKIEFHPPGAAGDACLSLETQFSGSDFGLSPVCTCSYANGRLRLGRRTFPVRGYQTWAGNWCWDMAHVDPAVANAILRHVRSLAVKGRPSLRPDQGWEELWDAYQAGQEIEFGADGQPKVKAG